MVDGDIGSPTWKFTQYDSSFAISLLALASAKTDLHCQASIFYYLCFWRCGRSWSSNQCGLLTRPYRCFGDKGDVEDITEGKSNTVFHFDMPPTFLNHEKKCIGRLKLLWK